MRKRHRGSLRRELKGHYLLKPSIIHSLLR